MMKFFICLVFCLIEIIVKGQDIDSCYVSNRYFKSNVIQNQLIGKWEMVEIFKRKYLFKNPDYFFWYPVNIEFSKSSISIKMQEVLDFDFPVYEESYEYSIFYNNITVNKVEMGVGMRLFIKELSDSTLVLELYEQWYLEEKKDKTVKRNEVIGFDLLLDQCKFETWEVKQIWYFKRIN